MYWSTFGVMYFSTRVSSCWEINWRSFVEDVFTVSQQTIVIFSKNHDGRCWQCFSMSYPGREITIVLIDLNILSKSCQCWMVLMVSIPTTTDCVWFLIVLPWLCKRSEVVVWPWSHKPQPISSANNLDISKRWSNEAQERAFIGFWVVGQTSNWSHSSLAAMQARVCPTCGGSKDDPNKATFGNLNWKHSPSIPDIGFNSNPEIFIGSNWSMSVVYRF